MSGDLSSTHWEMATNDFVNDLKSLSLSQTTHAYSDTMERLCMLLKQATPNGLMANKPLAFAVVDNLYRSIPIFAQKLSDGDENYQQTNLFLKILTDLFQGLCLLDLFLTIKDSSRVKIIYQNYTSLLEENYFTSDNKYDHLVTCLLPIISYSCAMISINEDHLPPNFISYLLDFTKTNWQNEQRQPIVHNILGLMKIYSRNPSLAPLVIHSEWPKACIQWLETMGPRSSYKTDFLICLILQKLARHTLGVDTLNQLNCIQALHQSKKQMKKDYNDDEYASIHFIQCIIYALLIEADEIKRNSMLADRLVCNVLEQLISYTLAASKSDIFVHKGCHLSELLCVLSKLFVNDDILKKCLKESSQLFGCLCQLLLQLSVINSDAARMQQIQNDEALVAVANLLWSISFHESYHEKFKSNRNLMHTLSNLATSSSLYTNPQNKSSPRDICSLKKATEGILWNLKSFHLTQQKDISEEKKPLIMISYSHSDSTFCMELVEHLSQHIPIWVDYKQINHNTAHTDDLWEEIAGAMEMASIIVLIISKEYYDSKSCRQELSYASDTLKKRIVPIYAPNQQYKANGWLGIRIAGQKYVHFGRKAYQDALSELLSLVAVDQRSITVPKSPQVAIPTKASVVENTLKNWTSNDIRKWFDDNHIEKDLITLFADQFHTGTALIAYAHHLKQFYRHEYREIFANYQKTFLGKRLQTVHFVTFIDALWRLREEYDPQSKMEDAWEKYTGNQALCTMKNFNEGMTWL